MGRYNVYADAMDRWFELLPPWDRGHLLRLLNEDLKAKRWGAVAATIAAARVEFVSLHIALVKMFMRSFDEGFAKMLAGQRRAIVRGIRREAL